MDEQLEALRTAAKQGNEKRCSDYDDDCQHVQCPLSCWVGGTFQAIDGTIVEMRAADGYCPMLRSTSTRSDRS